jgi:2-polyprenyl-3-methyl-5-hydroxy-6-metoxy-1,4-benzoquinol methylase
MRKINCYLCKSSKKHILFKQESDDLELSRVLKKKKKNIKLNWVICKNCGFVYRDKILNNKETSDLYSKYHERVFNKTDPDQYFNKIISLPKSISENHQKINWLNQNLKKKFSKKKKLKVLDVGCGGGTLLFTVKSKINTSIICGVELNPVYAKLAKKKLKANILSKEYKSGLFGFPFDLLINAKVLEHIADPLPFLQEIENDLTEDGLLFIEVPDISDMYNLPPDNERFGIVHIYFYSKNTLSALLEKAGFLVIKKRVISSKGGRLYPRSYLQIIAKKNNNKVKKNTKRPYEDVKKIISRVNLNLKKYKKKIF